MRRWEQEEERIRQAVVGAAAAKAQELGLTEEEMKRALTPLEQVQVLAFPGASGRNMQEMQAASPQFITVWPNYIDANKTLPEGRRIPKARACPGPVGAQDIADVVFELGLPCLVEPHKRYPRDHAAYGRVRVELVNPATGKPWDAQYATRRALLFKLGATIPTLKSRMVRMEAERAWDQAQLERGAAASASSSSLAGGGGDEEGAGGMDASGGGGGKANPKKKGKKKGRK